MQRRQSRAWAKNLIENKNFMAQPTEVNEDEDDLLAAISKAKNMGAKPKKNPLELMAERLRNLYNRDKGQMFTPR